MLIALYHSKIALKTNIGRPLEYVETSAFGPEYKANGEFAVSNRPQLREGYQTPKGQPKAKEFFATVTMVDGLIAKVK
jgi:hypothetical protein